MLLPIGFGSKLRKYPFAVIGICAICLAWSVSFFKIIKLTEIETEQVSKQFIELFANTLVESCQIHFANNSDAAQDCNKLQLLNQSRQIASEQDKHDKKNILKEINKSKSLQDFFSTLNLDNENLDSWPDDYQKALTYPKLVSFQASMKDQLIDIHSEQGFLTPKKKGVFQLIQASFTHASWEHLLSNLLILFLFGIWVEQALGFFEVFIIFIAGSYVGMLSEVYLNHPSAVLGASAGIMALLGAFYVIFYRTELTFFVYFKKIHIPCKWIFPCLFLVDDLLQIGAHQQNGVAHWAHFGGMLTGMLLGWIFRQQMNLGAYDIFPEERALTLKLKQSTDNNECINLFSQLLDYNPRHYPGYLLFLDKINKQQIKLKNEKTIEWLESNLKFFLSYMMKRRPNNELLKTLSLVPSNISLKHCLDETPMSQILFLADQSANAKNFACAKRLYHLALNKNPNGEQIYRINAALKVIDHVLENQGA